MNWVAVALGGAIGASCRYAIAASFPLVGSRFPLATFIANGIGCLLMGFGYMLIVERALLPDPWRQFLLVGILGALTTYSSFAIEVVSLIHQQSYKLAGLYLLATTCCCIAAIFAGLALAKLVFN